MSAVFPREPAQTQLDAQFASLDNCQPIQLPRYSGVYFLRQGTQIVYVGQSKNVAVRVAAHWADNCKSFDNVQAMRVPAELLDSVEQYWIRKLRPKYNYLAGEPDSEASLRR